MVGIFGHLLQDAARVCNANCKTDIPQVGIHFPQFLMIAVLSI